MGLEGKTEKEEIRMSWGQNPVPFKQEGPGLAETREGSAGSKTSWEPWSCVLQPADIERAAKEVRPNIGAAGRAGRSGQSLMRRTSSPQGPPAGVTLDQLGSVGSQP